MARQSQSQVVAELGCDFGQGFLWSRPGLPENLPEIFLSNPAA